MQVRATAQGYYDQKLRPEGVEFTIQSEKEFSKIWMEKIDGGAKPQKSAKKVSAAEAHYEALEKALPIKEEKKEAKDNVI